MLQEAGSAWLVASRDEGYALERRLAEAVVASAREALDVEAPEEHLRRAWVATYGLHPDASRAYAEAVKAVEAAAQPVVTPAETKATLGKMVPALRDAPGKWEVVLAARLGFDQVEVLRPMADLLWQGHTDRHGTRVRCPSRKGRRRRPCTWRSSWSSGLRPG